MRYEELLSLLSVAEKLKCNTRHCDTSSGRRESVAEHSWRLSLMAMLLEDEFPNTDINKVIKMCLIHDLGEAFTGDIATFDKTEDDSNKEEQLYLEWIDGFPEAQKKQFQNLVTEMSEQRTKEAKLYKALDKLEAVIQHNEADIASWLPLEYDLQLTYGAAEVAFSPYLSGLKKHIDEWTRDKIDRAASVRDENEIAKSSQIKYNER
ncbi:MAG: HD family hydrolase [Lachnospiraceae bacterium]